MAGDDRGGRAPGGGDNAGTRNTEQGAMSGGEEIPPGAAEAAPDSDEIPVPVENPSVTAPDVEAGPAEPAPLRPSEQADPKVFVHGRELSEVHLLLDNISANPTTTVVELAKNRPPLLAGEDWVEQICRISWPPQGSNADRAHEAALLIAAKDYLNRLSHPASGSTIAFTLLVTQEDGGASGEPAAAGSAPATPSRSSLARTAYPDLLRKAASFRRWMLGMSCFLIFALLLTCAISWYVAYGNAALSEMSAARVKLDLAQKAVDDAETAEASAKAAEAQRQSQSQSSTTGRSAAVPAVGGQTPTQQPTNASTPAATPYVGYCARGKPPVYTSATQLQTCRALTLARTAIGRAEIRLAGWVCWWCFKDLAEFDMPTEEEFSPLLFLPEPAKAPEAPAGKVKAQSKGAPQAPAAAATPRAPAAAESPQAAAARAMAKAKAEAKKKERLAKRAKAQHDDDLLLADAPARATAYANIIATAVLPFLYGLLGAGAAIVRSLSRKIRASLLSPRDLHLSLQQLALGAVIGACIGLFVAGPSDAGEGLLGPVTLSASALSFIAGFGVEAVFQGIESLITRIFNLTQAPTGNRGDGLPAN